MSEQQMTQMELRDREIARLNMALQLQQQQLIRADHVIDSASSFFRDLPKLQAIMFLAGMCWGAFLMRALMGGFQ